MALIQLEINQPQVFTAKCNEPQVVVSDGKDERSGVVIPLSVRTDFTRRGLKNTKMEFLVVYLGYNLRKYHKYRLKKEKSTQSKGLLN
jgi:hypothetical protein